MQLVRASAVSLVVAACAALSACQSPPAPRTPRPVARPEGSGVLIVTPPASKMVAGGCPDAVVASIPARASDAVAQALRAAGFTVVDSGDEPHAFEAELDAEIRYCNADVGLANGVVGVALKRKGALVRRSEAEGELSTPSPLASVARDIVDGLVHDADVIAAVDAARASR